MFKPDPLADKAGAILFEKIDQRLESLLAEHGVSDPSELTPTQMNEVSQRAIVEAAGCFPTANLTPLAHGFRSLLIRRLCLLGTGSGRPLRFVAPLSR